MDKLDNIDNLFGQLSNQEKQAPEGVWEHILADQKRKRRAGMLWWMYGSIGLILIVGLAGYYQLKTSEQTVANKNTAWLDAPKNNTPSASTITDAPQALPKEMPSPTYPEFLTPTQYNNNGFLTKPITLSAKDGAQTAVDKNAENKTVSGQTSAAAEKNKDVTSSEIAPVESGKETIPEKQKIEDKKPADKTIRKKNTPQKHPYFIEPSIGYSYSFRNLSSKSLPEHVAQRNRTEVKLMTPALSLVLGKQISANWNIQSGLLYNIQGLSASYTVSNAQRKVFVEVDPSMKKYDTALSYIYIQDSVYKLERGNSINGDQKYHYLRIPVVFEWQRLIRKFTYFVSAGVDMNILLAARGDVQDYQTARSGVFVPIKQIALQHIGLDFMGRTGVLFPVFGKPDLKFSLSMRGLYSPVSIFGKEVPVKQYNYSFALEFGVRKQLK